MTPIGSESSRHMLIALCIADDRRDQSMQHRSKPDHSYHEQPRANDERRSLQLPAIVASASPEDYCGSDAPPAEAEPRMIPLFNESRLGWVSPVEPPPMVSGFYHNSPSGAISSQHGHLSSSMMHNPKRAYRQRRKDPSCDACRERKVKVGQWLRLSVRG